MNEFEDIKRKSFIRYLLIVLIIFFVIFVIFSIVLLSYNYKNFIDESLKSCSDIASIIEISIKDLLNHNENLILENALSLSNLNYRITIIDCDGKVLYDNKVDASLMETHFDRTELFRSIQTGSSYYIRTSKTIGKRLFYYSKSMTENGKCLGFLRISKEISSLKSNNLFYILILFSFFLLSFIINLYFYLIHSRYLFNIIDFMIKNIEQITDAKQYKGNNYNLYKQDLLYDKKIQNKIESKLLLTFSNAKEKIIKNDIAIISNIFENFDEPIFLFSNNGICLVANNIARKYFIPDKFVDIYKDKYYWEIFISSDISKNIQETIEKKDKTVVEIELLDKLFLLRVIYLNFLNSVFVIFNDISEAKKYYELKKGILSAINHELKTPLTSISGFLDQIIIESEDKKLEEILSYASIAKRNCDRLILLTNDIIELERMHYVKKLNIVNVDISSLTNEILNIFNSIASKKNLDLSFKNKDEKILFSTDKDLFEQIAINLIDNAIKYTEKGFVKISIEKIDKNLRFIVEDSGIGIEKKEIPKIFEPFYCIDKSRSKEKGGTGLGLAIVKRATENLGGNIEIISSPYNGSKFIVNLPNLNLSNSN